MSRSLCCLLMSSLGWIWLPPWAVGQEPHSRGPAPSSPTSARTPPTAESASAPPEASRHPAPSQSCPTGSFVPRIVTPWAGSVAPVYPQWGGGRLYQSPRFPDYRTEVQDVQPAPPRSPKGTPPAAPTVSGARTPSGAPLSDLRSRATLLAPPAFYRPYFTAVNDPLRVQYGPGVRPFLPLSSPPRYPW
jgi:hypothetical protein